MRVSSRREFLQQVTVSLAAVSPLSQLAVAAPTKLPFKISLAEWSLHVALQAKEIDHLDFARIAKEDFGIEGVEYVNAFFKDKAKDQAYLKEMKSRADDLGVRNVLIMVDSEGKLGDPDPAALQKAIDNHRKWLDAAAYLECHSIRVNAQSSGTYDEQLERAADGLRRLTLIAEPMNLNVIVENHGGLSSNGKWLSEVMRRVDHPHCGTLPDFGNFRVTPTNLYDNYEGVTELMPFAKGVSAKSYDFDSQGEETAMNYTRMLKIVTDAGYHGFVGIEYEGKNLSEMDGIRKTKELLERVRTQLAGTHA